MTEKMTQEDLIQKIKNSTNGSWGLLTGNGFNISCNVRTDYKSLCEALIDSFKDELSTDEHKQLSDSLSEHSHDFESWLAKQSSEESYMNQIALNAIHRQWLSEFVYTCSKDSKQYDYSESLNEFLKLFQYYFTLNVDPFFYRRCLGKDNKPKENKKNESNSNGDSSSKTAAKSSAITDTVYLGTAQDNLIKADPSYLTRKAKEELNMLPEEGKKPDKIKDGFTTHGTIKEDVLANNEMTFFQLHGACHLTICKTQRGEETLCKVKAQEDKSLIKSILEEDPRNNSSIFSPNRNGKLRKINANEFLRKQFEAFGNIKCKNLVIYGASLAGNDAHIWSAVNENKAIENVYISYHSPDSNVETRANSSLHNKTCYFFKSTNLIKAE